VNSCVNSPEDGPVGPKHVEIRRYMNKRITTHTAREQSGTETEPMVV